jgi:hypothetical protein
MSVSSLLLHSVISNLPIIHLLYCLCTFSTMHVTNPSHDSLLTIPHNPPSYTLSSLTLSFHSFLLVSLPLSTPSSLSHLFLLSLSLSPYPSLTPVFLSFRLPPTGMKKRTLDASFSPSSRPLSLLSRYSRNPRRTQT